MGCGEAGGKTTPIQPADLVTATDDIVAAIETGESLSSPLSAFGEMLTAELTPEIQLTFGYNIDPEYVVTEDSGSGAVSQALSNAVLQTGAAIDSHATVYSKRLLKYNTGQGGLVRFTALYTTGVAGSKQIVGLGTTGDGFFFGYNGTSFGILHRRGGNEEYRALTIGTKSSHAENITITLNGVAVTDVPVTNGANTTVTANEIAAYNYSDVNGGWNADAYGNVVIFHSHHAEPKTGVFSLSGATSAVGTFAQQVAGVLPTDSWIPQSSWNVDTMLTVNGASGQILDPTKGNVYQIRYQWLGYGMIRFYIENSATGAFQKVHQLPYANLYTQTSVVNPSLPMMAHAENTTNSTNITLKTPSWMAAVEGSVANMGDIHGATSSKTLADANETPILSIRSLLVYQGKENRIPIEISIISAAVEHTKAVTINLYRNPTLVGSVWTDVSTNTSPVIKDTSATSLSGGTLLFSMSLGKSGNQVLALNREDLALFLPGDILTATADPVSNNNAEIVISFNWVERH